MKSLKIGKAAKKIGISSRTLKEWEKLLDISVPRDNLGHRVYDAEWVEYFNQVKALYLDQKRSWGEIKHIIRVPGAEEEVAPQMEVHHQEHHQVHHQEHHHHRQYQEHSHTPHHHHHQPSGSELVFY